MKLVSVVLIIFIPILASTQYQSVLSTPVSPNARLLSIGDTTILVNQMDLKNEAHKWTTYDSALNVLAVKKLVTPAEGSMLSQTYLESNHSIIRVDQASVDNQLYISAFVFDGRGNVIYSQDIADTVHQEERMPVAPYLIAQSQDKQRVCLVQTMSIDMENVVVSTIVFNNELKIISNSNHTIAFDPALLDMFMPMVTNNGKVVIITADKFDSYKLGTAVTFHVMSPDIKPIQTIEISFDRKKLRDLNFSIEGEYISYNALFSNQSSKKDIAGVIFSDVDLLKKTQSAGEEFLFSDEVKAGLKKTFGAEGRKGNILNFVSLLPADKLNNGKQSFAILLPSETGRRAAANTTVPPYLAGQGDIERIQQTQAYATSLVGTQPQGYSQPMSVAEANNYAVISGRSIGGALPGADYYVNENATGPQSTKKKVGHSRNLLFFSSGKLPSGESKRFVKVKALDEGYGFSTYIPGHEDYSLLHYVVTGLGKASVNKTSINLQGGVTEKKLFEDSHKVLLPGYNVVVRAASMIAFFEEKTMGQMGLIKIPL